MLSRRTLGAAALGGLGAGAIAFAIVDQLTSISRTCGDATAACAHQAVPGVAVVFVVIGVIALALGLVPAIAWVILTIRMGHAVEEPGVDTAEQAIEEHRRALDED